MHQGHFCTLLVCFSSSSFFFFRFGGEKEVVWFSKTNLWEKQFVNVVTMSALWIWWVLKGKCVGFLMDRNHNKLLRGPIFCVPYFHTLPYKVQQFRYYLCYGRYQKYWIHISHAHTKSNTCKIIRVCKVLRRMESPDYWKVLSFVGVVLKAVGGFCPNSIYL